MFTSLLLVCAISFVQAQQRICGSTRQQLEQLKQQPHYKEFVRKGLLQSANASAQCDTLIIPVVVHVVYNNSEQNVSDEQIQSQIDALNEDYAAQNATTVDVPVVWQSQITDSKFRFVLARQDPAGNNSNGITRTLTSVTSFSAFDATIKYEFLGGADAWPPSSYLNLWVCNVSNNALGFATFPGSIPEEDGVTVHYKAFGRTGDLNKKYNLGRTATHEVGHWFRMIHIWGDQDDCTSDDFIQDTPIQEVASYGNPKYPKTDMCSPGDGIMFMNYMDYTDDKSMMFFTPEQIDTMQSVARSIYRDSLCLSQGGTLAQQLNHDVELTIVSPLIKTDTRCFNPVVKLINNGTDTITHLDIVYNIVNGAKRSYSWSGTLLANSSADVTLPYIAGAEGLNVLEVRIADADSNKVNNYSSRSYKVTKDNTAGCEDDDPKVYPNPVTGNSFCVQSNFASSDVLTVRVINMMGQKVYESLDNKANPGDRFLVNLINQPQGVYVVQLINGKESRGSKFLYLPGDGAVNTTTICAN